MDEIISNTYEDIPHISIMCPVCSDWIDMAYGIKYGAKIDCEGCRKEILITFTIEALPP